MKKQLIRTASRMAISAIALSIGAKSLNMGLEAALMRLTDNSSRYEEVQKQKRPSPERYAEYPNPVYAKDDNFASDSETMVLARAICGEGRGELDNAGYINGILDSIFTRAKKRGVSIKDVLLETRLNKNGRIVYHYTTFDPRDVNYRKIKDPINNGDAETLAERIEIWKRCYDIARKAIEDKNNGKLPLKEITNYMVVRGNPFNHRTKREAKKYGIPSWAYEMENGRFILDKSGKRIPRKPVDIVFIEKDKHAYFYNFRNF